MLANEKAKIEKFITNKYDEIPGGWKKAYQKWEIESNAQSMHTKANALQTIFSFWQTTKVANPRKVTRKDVERWKKELEKDLSPETVSKRLAIFKTIMSTYYYGYKSKKYPKCVEWIRAKTPNNNNMRDKILSPGEIDALIRACNNSKQKALISILYEGALRLGEALSLRIRDIEFTKYGVRLRILGKTGERTILLFKSEPYIRQWVQTHPLKSNPNAYLFITRWGGKYRQMTRNAVFSLIKTLAKSAGIKKNIHPHMLRHTRLTELAKKLTEQELKMFAGWVGDSKMARVYVHLSGRDLERALLQKIAGIKIEEEESKEPEALEPKICPRCGYANAPDALYCARCALALDDQVAVKVKDLGSMEEMKQVAQIQQENKMLKEKLAELEMKISFLEQVLSKDFCKGIIPKKEEKREK